MKLRQFVVVSAAAMAGSGLFGTAAEAAIPTPFHISPNPVAAGGVARVVGFCPSPQPHIAVSAGFVAPIRLLESGRVVNKPGQYSVSMKCGDDTMTTTFTIEAGPSISVRPKVVEPGGRIDVSAYCLLGGSGGNVGSGATSPGFAAPIAIDWWGQGYGNGRGVGKAADKPGRYTASFTCGQETRTTTFTIATKSSPVPPQVVVKPKAAPQTGGGFLAWSQ